MVYRDKGFLTRDPSVWHCQTSSQPLVWTESMYVTPESTELMEESRAFGLGHGLSIPVHESGSVVSMLSLVRDKPLQGEAELQQAIHFGLVMANCAHVVSKRLLVPALQMAQRPRAIRN